MPSSYNASDIKVLEGLEPVRKRPGMYIGSTDERGIQELLKEITDNSVDEAIAGFAKHVYIPSRFVVKQRFHYLFEGDHTRLVYYVLELQRYS